MLRRLNYTNRKRIIKSNINISIVGEKEDLKSFHAALDLDDLDLPGEAKVVVEAWHRMMQSQRYDFCTVDNITPPEDTHLGLLGFTDNIKFRLQVIDASGKILASSTTISITKEERKDTLLPVIVTDLDYLLWKISMEGDDGGPVLLLNERIPTIKTVAAHDPRFIHSVYPAVLRQILMHIAVIENVDLRNPDVDWQSNWLIFMERIFVAPPEGRYSENNDDVKEWIEGAVLAFTRNRKRDWNNRLLGWEL